jgi:hypothetical protein
MTIGRRSKRAAPFANQCEEIWGVEEVAGKRDYRFWNRTG